MEVSVLAFLPEPSEMLLIGCIARLLSLGVQLLTKLPLLGCHLLPMRPCLTVDGMAGRCVGSHDADACNQSGYSNCFIH